MKNYLRALPIEEQRCPYMVSKGEGADFCELTNMKPCELQSGGTCEEWEEIQREWAEEAEVEDEVDDREGEDDYRKEYELEKEEDYERYSRFAGD